MNIPTLTIANPEQELAEDFIGYSLPQQISWNELMLLVEKIESLGYTAEIKLNHCSIIEIKQNDTFLDFDGFFISSVGLNATSKIEAVWKTVVAFIKTYRQ